MKFEIWFIVNKNLIQNKSWINYNYLRQSSFTLLDKLIEKEESMKTKKECLNVINYIDKTVEKIITDNV